MSFLNAPIHKNYANELVFINAQINRTERECVNSSQNHGQLRQLERTVKSVVEHLFSLSSDPGFFSLPG